MIYTASIACARQLNIEADVKELIKGGIKYMHVDFMDGHNVPNLCMNLDTVKELKESFSDVIIDAHLMVTNPQDYVIRCKGVGVDYMTIDPKTVSNPLVLLKNIRKNGMKSGIVVNPNDTFSDVKDLLPFVDLLLIMSIIPGIYGREFINNTYHKIEEFYHYRKINKLDYLISVDGGINLSNGRKSKEMGADMVVLGVFAVFKQNKPISEACQEFIKAFEAEEKL
ncbi:MAG: ribulose-phosphate 3-epimerase [Clostridia bacterium]|nr:ribulose-phosphate 3-epimerase [Clostridia bacterium]